MKKPSEIIKQSCCGNMLDEPKCDLIAKVEKLEKQLEDAKREAESLALALYKQHYSTDPSRVEFELCDSPAGVISQIDNMVCGLVHKSDERQLIIDVVHGAGNHLRRVMGDYPYCDHVQAVKHFADITLKQRGLF